jgi:hypothetical protein
MPDEQNQYVPDIGDRVHILCFSQPSKTPGDPRRVLIGEAIGAISRINYRDRGDQIYLDGIAEPFTLSVRHFCTGTGGMAWWRVKEIRLVPEGSHPLTRWGDDSVRPAVATGETLERAVDQLWAELAFSRDREGASTAVTVAEWFAHLGYTSVGEHETGICPFCPGTDPYRSIESQPSDQG